MLNPRIIKDTVAFVAQYDLPYDGLTPREVLLYHSMLNSVKNDYSAISKHVDFILMLLGLENVANIVLQTTCAKTQGGLSGGQKRRLSVALAMIKRPSIIILDEPTSGLDCKSSFEIIKNLKVLSEHGYNIIAIIHQPRQEVFDLFTHCTVVSSGSVVFNGKRNDCYDYFVDINKQQGFSQEKVYNTCDYIGDSVSRLERVLPVFKQKENSLNESVAKKYGNLTTTTSISTWAQIAVTNARYWNTRPLTRKLSMLLIAFLTSLALGMLQHRSGNDIISISLAIKGIIIACLGLGALKNINLSFDYVSFI